MKIYLEYLIHQSQTGFMQGRNILHNVRIILDLIKYAELENIEAILISLDFEKAFDRVKLHVLYDVLRYFDFGDRFIKWTQLLYAQFESCTTNNGEIFEWFMPTRGLHQGCLANVYYWCLNRHLCILPERFAIKDLNLVIVCRRDVTS